MEMYKKIKLDSRIKIRMLLILFFGAIIAAVIFAYGFFAMQKELWNSVKQCRESLNQIDQSITTLRH